MWRLLVVKSIFPPPADLYRKVIVKISKTFIAGLIGGVRVNSGRCCIDPQFRRMYRLLNSKTYCFCSIGSTVKNFLFIFWGIAAIYRFAHQVNYQVGTINFFYPITLAATIPFNIAYLFCYFFFNVFLKSSSQILINGRFRNPSLNASEFS